MVMVLSPSQPGKGGMRLVDALFEDGRQWSRREMVLEARPEDIDALSGLARAYARSTMGPDYDPSSGADRDRASLFQAERSESKRLGEEIRNAATGSQDAQAKAVAAAALVGEPPVAPLLIMITAAIVISMTLSPSLHDQVFMTLRDDLNWAVSLTLVLGAMMVWGLIAEAAGATVSPRAALWGGIIIGIGFGVLRLSTAEDFPEVVYACGLSAIEVGTLVFADAVGAKHRAEVSRWQEWTQAAADAAALAAASQKAYDRLVSEKADRDRAIWMHVEYADERRECSGDAARRETSFVEAICAGYRHGIAENVGRAQGYSHGA